MLVEGVLPVLVPGWVADEESIDSNVDAGDVEIEGVILDVPVVRVVDTETTELDDDGEEVDIFEIGVGGLGSGDSTEAAVVVDSELLFVVEIDTVELLLLEDEVGAALSVVEIETSLFVTATAFAAEVFIVFGVTRTVVVEVLTGPG